MYLEVRSLIYTFGLLNPQLTPSHETLPASFLGSPIRLNKFVIEFLKLRYCWTFMRAISTQKQKLNLQNLLIICDWFFQKNFTKYKVFDISQLKFWLNWNLNFRNFANFALNFLTIKLPHEKNSWSFESENLLKVKLEILKFCKFCFSFIDNKISTWEKFLKFWIKNLLKVKLEIMKLCNFCLLWLYNKISKWEKLLKFWIRNFAQSETWNIKTC